MRTTRPPCSRPPSVGLPDMVPNTVRPEADSSGRARRSRRAPCNWGSRPAGTSARRIRACSSARPGRSRSPRGSGASPACASRRTGAPTPWRRMSDRTRALRGLRRHTEARPAARPSAYTGGLAARRGVSYAIVGSGSPTGSGSGCVITTGATNPATAASGRASPTAASLRAGLRPTPPPERPRC